MAGADHFSVVRKIDAHAIVKDVKRAFPQTVITERFTITYYATIYLVELFEPTICHQNRQRFAAYSTGAIGNNRLVFEMIVFSGFKFSYEITGRGRIGYHGIFKLTDLSFESITPIKKRHRVTLCFTLRHEFIDFLGAQMFCGTQHLVTVLHLNFFGAAKSHEFRFHFDTKPWKIGIGTLRPFDFQALKRRISSSGLYIFFHRFDIATHGPVDPLRRNNNTTGKFQSFTQFFLPQRYGLRILDWGEMVV